MVVQYNIVKTCSITTGEHDINMVNHGRTMLISPGTLECMLIPTDSSQQGVRATQEQCSLPFLSTPLNPNGSLMINAALRSTMPTWPSLLTTSCHFHSLIALHSGICFACWTQPTPCRLGSTSAPSSSQSKLYRSSVLTQGIKDICVTVDIWTSWDMRYYIGSLDTLWPTWIINCTVPCWHATGRGARIQLKI